MELKDQIKEEAKKYIDTFDKYDNGKITEEIKKKEEKYQERKSEYDNKWSDEDIFPTDIPIKEEEKKQLDKMEEQVNKLKNDLDKEIKENERKLKTSISEWEAKIDARRAELVEYDSNRDKYLEEKSKLEKELEKQIEGIRVWDKNGIDHNDVLYRKRKDEVIPNLENKIEEVKFKLDKTKIREEYKELGIIKAKIIPAKLWTREATLDKLAEIFEISKEDPGKEETNQEVQKEDPAKEETNQEVQKDEPAKEEKNQEVQKDESQNEPKDNQAKKVIRKPEEKEVIQMPDFLKQHSEPIKQDPIVIPNPRKTEPVKQEPIVIPNPRKTEPVKQGPIVIHDPKKSEPIKSVQPKNADAKEALAQIIIGRKIKVKFTRDGKSMPVVNSKNYFKYIQALPKSELATELLNRLKINDNTDAVKLNVGNINPMVIYSMIQALDKKLILEDDVKSAVEAINAKDKKTLDGILPIKWDKKDLSKRAFLPWNRGKRDEIDEISKINSDMIDVIGEYEPNPLKRLLKQGKKLLPSRKSKQEKITDGSEKKNPSKAADEKANFKEDIKPSKTYFDLMNLMNRYVVNEKEETKWLEEVNLKKEKGEITKEEAESLKIAAKEKLKQVETPRESKSSEKEIEIL